MGRERSLALATADQIEAAAELAQARGRLAIDTEFISEGHYRALLCLTQVAVDDPSQPGGTRILLIDGLNQPDIGPLARQLGDPAVEVVLHAGRQDVPILRRAWKTDLNNLFDTQVAAGFAGAAAQTGYGNLVAAVLGRRVGKSASYTRWDVRPLTPEQLRYAAEDVAHLLELTDELHRRLEASGRLQWAREECRRLEAATDERDPYAVWERLPRVSHLDPRARAVARELAAWRERTAAAEDRPVASVLADQTLVELATRQPTEVGALAHIRGLHRGTVKRRGRDIVAAVAAGRQAEPIPRPRLRSRADPTDAPVISLAEALLRARALEAGVAYELIASRSELEAVVAAARLGEPDPEVRISSGWRRELVGEDVRKLIAGGGALAVAPGPRVTFSRHPPRA